MNQLCYFRVKHTFRIKCVTERSSPNVGSSECLQSEAQMSNQVCYWTEKRKCRTKCVTEQTSTNVESNVFLQCEAQMSNQVCVASESWTNVESSVLLNKCDQVCSFRVKHKFRIKCSPAESGTHHESTLLLQSQAHTSYQVCYSWVKRKCRIKCSVFLLSQAQIANPVFSCRVKHK